MPHPALQAQRREAALDQKRGAGVAKSVEAQPGQTRALCRRHQHPEADVVRTQRRPPLTGKDECILIGARRASRSQSSSQRLAHGHAANSEARLRRFDHTVDNRAPHPEMGRLAQIEVAPAQRNRLRDP